MASSAVRVRERDRQSVCVPVSGLGWRAGDPNSPARSSRECGKFASHAHRGERSASSLGWLKWGAGHRITSVSRRSEPEPEPDSEPGPGGGHPHPRPTTRRSPSRLTNAARIPRQDKTRQGSHRWLYQLGEPISPSSQCSSSRHSVVAHQQKQQRNKFVPCLLLINHRPSC